MPNLTVIAKELLIRADYALSLCNKSQEDGVNVRALASQAKALATLVIESKEKA